MICLADKPPKPSTNVVYVVPLEDDIIKNKFRGDFFISCC